MRVSVTGLDAAIKAAGALGAEVQEIANRAVADTASEGERYVKELHTQGGANAKGRTYKRRSVVHRASAPGDAPAPDVGTLLNSIYHEKLRPSIYVVGSRLLYAFWLEYGTRKMSARKMSARPMWRPAAKYLEKELAETFEEYLRKGLK